MTAPPSRSNETARKVEALETHAQRLMGVFVAAGYEAVAPPIIQPADKFLDVVGEQLRARTYVFTDQDGEELCLRPDLTVPACLLHLARHPGDGNVKAKYCYNGPAFRFQPVGADAAHPREFRQTGIEFFAGDDKEKAEAETVAVLIEALRGAGLADFKLRLGDLGLFRALLKALDMPERWREKLRYHFWRPEAFRAELKRLTTCPAPAFKDVPAELVEGLDAMSALEAEKRVAKHMESIGVEPIGARSVAEIAANLQAHAADVKAVPLARETADVIESYLRISAPPRAAVGTLDALIRARGADVPRALSAFQKRLDYLAGAGIDLARAEFSAEFGRNLEYYTGFVFEIEVPGLGRASPVAGGGRYDGLMRALGAPSDIPAVGAAIHTERLLAALAGGAK